ncbi:4-amino-4-deoxy-L-arabinose transferase-like glycosyltransferase [Sphingomonas sp. PP-F2F-G114-C0414]|nr:4-amino-4-deoxy-L-arabinose transferase-like glycosyltransferase [Sphingomonas sp. PP-F2F-G114-C0414]
MDHTAPQPCSPAKAGAQTRHPSSRVSNLLVLAALAIILITLALLRPVDHDESQYVAAAALTAHGLLPYRDFAYLQTPLQPYLFAPIAALAGAWTWPALRIVNALLGIATMACVHTAARTLGAKPKAALACAALFATCDILLFSIGTARNDALPAALLAAALSLIARAQTRDATRNRALLIGLLLAAAAAAKISYAFPALAYGLYALIHRRHRPGAILLGTLPVIVFVAWSYTTSPAGFVFGTLTFPARGPAEYYASRPWKMSLPAKAIDSLKFLALGAALPALILVARDASRRRAIGLFEALILAGLVAALLPFPTWRQYLLPVLPALFVRLSLIKRPGRPWRVALGVFAIAGLAPSIAALASPDGLSLAQALREGRTLGRALDRRGIGSPIATLSPQMLPAANRLPDPVFATGPFYFRSTSLLDPQQERALHLMSRTRTRVTGAPILTGGEAADTSGDASLDHALAAWAIRSGYRSVAVPGTRFTLYVPPAASPNPALR